MNLDFASLVTLDPPGVTVLQVEFYIELPQGSRDMTNGHGSPYRLTTYLGPDDICTMPPDVFLRDILGITLQDGPINLLHPEFNLTAAKTDSTIIEAEINMKVIRLATLSVIDHLFNQLCPGYSKEPHAALYQIWQTFNDSNGNTVFSSVFEYYTQILAASCPFMTKRCFPSASARLSWMALTLASLLAFVPTSRTTASCKSALPLTSAKPSKRCSRPPFALRQSSITSGLLPVRYMVVAVKPSPLRSTRANARRL